MLFGDEVVPRDLSKPVVIVDHAEAVFGPANEVLIHAVGDFVEPVRQRGLVARHVPEFAGVPIGVYGLGNRCLLPLLEC